MSRNLLAKITSTRSRARAVVITTPWHVRGHPTASPPECLRPVCKQLGVVAAELVFVLLLHVLGLLLEDVAPAHGLAVVGAVPGDELHLAVVHRAVFEEAVLVIPFLLGLRDAFFLVETPVGFLTVTVWARMCW